MLRGIDFIRVWSMIWKNKSKTKVYVFSAFVRDFSKVNRDIPALIESLIHRRISRAFEEKIMLTVTSVNGCTYCAWLHSRSALRAGVNQNELKRLLSLQFNQQIDDKEFVALNFAVHYAETDQKPDRELLNNLFESYGPKTANDILLRLRLIYFGNLLGNTFRIFLSRLKGEKQENSFWLTELVVSLIALPVLGPIAFLMKKKEKWPPHRNGGKGI